MPLPERVRHIWRWFGDLNETRRYSRLVEPDEGSWKVKTRAERILHSEMEAWARTTGVRLEPWHTAALSLLDESYTDNFNDARPVFRKPALQLTPQLFDAMFGKRK